MTCFLLAQVVPDRYAQQHNGVELKTYQINTALLIISIPLVTVDTNLENNKGF